jgi:uncharacterized membrane protein YbhN (UPF0104 family)
VLVAAVLVAVLGLLAVEARHVDWSAVLARLQWSMAAVAAGCALVSVLGAAWNLVGFSPVRLALVRAVLAQLAGSALKVVTPASVGTVAVSARVVHRSGAGTAPAVIAVAASQVAQLLVTVLLVAVVAALGGASAGLARPHVPGVAVAALLSGVAALLLTRRWWWRLVPVTATARLADVGPQLLATLRDPRRCLAGLGGALLLTLGLLGTLWASVRAMGGDLSVLAALVVLLAGSALGSTVPTPGGVGGVEAAMTAGLVTAGVPFATAVSAVVVFRALTFWLLVPAGMLAAAQLRRAHLL